MGVAVYAEEPFQDVPFAAACETAKKENKWVLIDFYTTWCGPCKMLDKVTWKDTEVKAWLKDNAINLKVDAEADVELAKKYKVNAYPTIVILKSDGTVLDRLTGYRPPKDFLVSVNNLKNGKDSLALLKESMAGDKANDPMVRLKYGRELANRGLYKEALAEYLWCFDNGLKYNQSFAGVRTSFLLGDITGLSKELPEALDELKKRRDNAAKLIVNGEVTFDRVSELTNLNKTLKDQKKNLEVFDQLLAKGKKEIAAKMVGQILDQLLSAHRYQDIIDNLGDLNDQMQKQFKGYQGLEKYQSEHDNPNKEEMLASFKDYTVQICAKYFATLLGVKRDDEANKMADQMIRFNNRGTTYMALIQYALKADNKTVANFYLERGMKTVSDEDKAGLKQFADQAFNHPDTLEPEED